MGLVTITSPEENKDIMIFKLGRGYLHKINRIKDLTGLDGPTQFERGYHLLIEVVDTLKQGGAVLKVDASGEKCQIRIPGYEPQPKGG